MKQIAKLLVLMTLLISSVSQAEEFDVMKMQYDLMIAQGKLIQEKLDSCGNPREALTDEEYQKSLSCVQYYTHIMTTHIQFFNALAKTQHQMMIQMMQNIR